VEHKLSPPPLSLPPPRDPRPRGRPRGRCRAEQWGWSFIVSLVSSKRMTCSSAMYSDTATLTLKYHIWHVLYDTSRRATCPERSSAGKIDLGRPKFGGRPRSLRRFGIAPRSVPPRGGGFSAARIRNIDIARVAPRKVPRLRRHDARKSIANKYERNTAPRSVIKPNFRYQLSDIILPLSPIPPISDLSLHKSKRKKLSLIITRISKIL